MTQAAAPNNPLAIDPSRLVPWLEANVPNYASPLTIARMTGGQSNPTYRLSTPARDYALRRKPPGALLPSAHAVDREYRVMAALAGSAVPVPAMHGLCTDESVIGSIFFVMDFVQGRNFVQPGDPALSPTERRALFRSMNATLAALHAIDPAAIGLADFGRPGNYIARQVARWSKQYRASETQTIAEMDRLIDWLPANLPPEGATSIVHGDYRLDNLIVDPVAPRIIAVLDWELSTLGDPVADLAYHCMAWRFTPELFRGIAGLDVAALGIPTEAEYVAAYAHHRGLGDIPHWHFYMAYNMFRFAAILQGVWHRALQGNAVGADAKAMGAKVAPIARLAWDEANRKVEIG
ncbi:MAG: phosphotransferase family protein [Rhodospirillaceae bacterium]|nr:phosphotransferase family protein [Rhodospirillaceae bacterium]